MNKEIISSFIFAVGCFAFFWLVIPQYDKVLDIRSATSDRQNMLTERKALRDNVVKLMGQYNSRKADIDKLIMLLPSGEHFDQIIEGVQAAAYQNGLQVESLQTSSQIGKSTIPYNISGVTVDVNGTYDSLLNFMKDLEKSSRLYDISDVQLSQTQGSGTGANSFSIEIKLSAYSLK